MTQYGEIEDAKGNDLVVTVRSMQTENAQSKLTELGVEHLGRQSQEGQASEARPAST